MQARQKTTATSTTPLLVLVQSARTGTREPLRFRSRHQLEHGAGYSHHTCLPMSALDRTPQLLRRQSNSSRNAETSPSTPLFKRSLPPDLLYVSSDSISRRPDERGSGRERTLSGSKVLQPRPCRRESAHRHAAPDAELTNTLLQIGRAHV